MDRLRQECRNRRTEQGLQAMAAYCRACMEEWRLELETAPLAEVPGLQGRIRGMREILDAVTPRETRRQATGGYV
jgi:hypothetical protein